jgi:hypothetical protein
MNNNKLIAEFMGMKYSDERSFDNGEWTHSIKSLSKFQTSWDWLMPVAWKINRDERYIGNEYRERLMDVVPYGHMGDIYEAVVGFIKTQNND